MDFIKTLSDSLGIDPSTAQAVAGAALGTVQSQLADKEDGDSAAQLGAAIPELGDWKSKAVSMLGGAAGAGPSDLGALLGGLAGGAKSEKPAAGGLGGLLGGLGGGAGGLMGAVAGAVGGAQAKDMAMLVGALGKLGLDPSKAMVVAPLMLDFLKDRLSPELLSTVLNAAPMLTGLMGGKGGDDKAGGGLLGGLGGMFG